MQMQNNGSSEVNPEAQALAVSCVCSGTRGTRWMRMQTGLSLQNVCHQIIPCACQDCNKCTWSHVFQQKIKMDFTVEGAKYMQRMKVNTTCELPILSAALLCSGGTIRKMQKRNTKVTRAFFVTFCLCCRAGGLISASTQMHLNRPCCQGSVQTLPPKICQGNGTALVTTSGKGTLVVPETSFKNLPYTPEF